MKKPLLLLFLIGWLTMAQGQKNCIECYTAFNQFDRMLLEQDTSTALILFEALNQEICHIPKGRYFQVSILYHAIGDAEKAKQNVQLAIENGLLGPLYFEQDLSVLIAGIAERHGADFSEKMLALNKALTQEKIARYGKIISRLKVVYDKDQELRKDQKYDACRSYGFRYHAGFPYDSTQNHEEMMRCYKEFGQKDSIVLAEFIAVVDSLGFVPGNDLIFAMFPISPIICHTAHFDFTGLEEKYLKSLELGTISPAEYAWWKGYHEEYNQEPFSYYFTHSEKTLKEMPAEAIETINAKRRSIGLPACPAVIWNTRRY